jgi:hypothetical protein
MVGISRWYCPTIAQKFNNSTNAQLRNVCPTIGNILLAAVNFCQMKIGLELVIHEEPDGRKFLNYWDWKHGNDVCCQIIDGELFKSEYDEEGKELPKKQISFADFVKLVEAVV